MEWQEDTKSIVASARREAKRRLSETLPCDRSVSLSLQQHYNQIASQSPLALLPALRKRKLAVDRTVDRGARATEEARLRKEYALRLAAVFQEADLPVCKILAGVSDAEEAWPRLFGTRRAKTLRNRHRAWEKFREWLIFSRGRVYPKGVADVLDFAAERFREGCGKTVLESFQASLTVIETVGRVPESSQISQDPTWQAQLKSYTADLVASSAPEQPAHMFTTCMLVSLEILVCSSDEPPYLRALVTGQPKQYIEVEAIKAVTDYATQVGESESQVRRRHIIFEGSKGLGGTWPTLHVGVDAAAPPSPDFQEVAAGDRGQYFVVTSRTTGLRRLHMVGCGLDLQGLQGQNEGSGASEAMASDDDKRQLITGADSDLQFVLGEAGLSLDAQYRVVQRHTTLRRFQAIADSRAEARVAGKADFGLADDTADGRQQIAGVVAAWELARDVITKETETRAEAKVLGQPRILQVTERQAMIKAVVAVHGQLGESETPSAEYLALKCEECEVNEPQASTLDAITSKKSTLTTSIQSSLDASGRIHITQHKAKSELPTTTEAYRKVLRVEAFTWLCMAARFKSKQWLQGLKLSDFDHFVNYILGEKVAQLSVPTSHQPNDVPTLSPPWHVVLAYEHRLRKEAFRLVNEEDQTLSAALATV
ncbi:unnamed protein product, partial [Symbiodinium necroappetens]